MTYWTKEATLDEIYDAGYETGKSIASNHSPDPADNHSDLNDMEINFQEQLREAEENYRSYTPFEFFAKEMNDREDADEAWEQYEEGIAKAFEERWDKINDDPKPITEGFAEQMTKDMLNDCYPEVEIAGRKYSPAEILYEMDYDYFWNILSDYIDNEGYEIIE